jgi:hypothetical protein
VTRQDSKRSRIHAPPTMPSHTMLLLHLPVQCSVAVPARPSFLLLRYTCGCCYTCTWGPPRSLRFLRSRRDHCVRGDHTLILHPLPAPAHGTLATCSICCNIRLKKDETFRIYTCNICVWPLQHMQHLDKTLATYVWNSWNIWKHTLAAYVMASRTYATSR